ncbi:MAG TPA: DUF397 domain-containing protein [Pseudonocardiaceae bacterium]|nr:DUF397 domain-containing protein [Pseudonocardiaceae bacterium]
MSAVNLTGAVWRKSTYSGNGGNSNCVEVAWRKSSYSGDGSNGNCVEVAFLGPAIAVRDSKNPAAGTLVLPQQAWTALRAAI